MKENVEKVYKCDYCRRKMFSAGAMRLHERMCGSNPKNKHKCFQYCRWLKIEVEAFTGRKSFYCDNCESEFYGKIMHSYKLERFSLNKERIREESLVRMPLDCELYSIEDGHDDEYLKKINE